MTPPERILLHSMFRCSVRLSISIYLASEVYKLCRAERHSSPVAEMEGGHQKAQANPFVDTEGNKHPKLSVVAMNKAEQSFTSQWSLWSCAGHGKAVSGWDNLGNKYTTAHFRIPAADATQLGMIHSPHRSC